jgi:quinolinate synthase
MQVPGEMFELAMEAQQEGKGVVGSTSNILSFILAKTKEASAAAAAAAAGSSAGAGGGPQRLRFVLGTEAGMVTSIVRGVEAILQREEGAGEGAVEVEIIFPVASEAVSASGEGGGSDMPIVPGVRGGEGCSTAGGCATCPFMKMNSLEALVEVLERCPKGKSEKEKEATPKDLLPFLPPRRGDVVLPSGKPVGEVGSLPIVHMRALMAAGTLSEELVADILTRPGKQQQQQQQRGPGGAAAFVGAEGQQQHQQQQEEAAATAAK